MQTRHRGVAALFVGLFLAGCGGGGGGEGELGDPSDVAGANGGTVGQNAAGGAKPSSAAGTSGTSAGTSVTGSGAAGTAPAAADPAAGAAGTAPGATESAPAATGTTPAATGTTPAATGTAPAATGTAPAATGAAPAAAATPPAAAGATPAAAPAGKAGATIVPLYTYPTDASWNTVIAAKAAHPRVSVIAVVNPANGPGGGVDAGYASGIARLTAAGIKVIGYVATGYAVNNPAAVKADIDRWRAFYPGQITGIFFDEQSNKAGDVPYYRDLAQHAKAQGLSFTVGNPGTDTSPAFVGALDVMLIYESAGLPSVNQLGGWHASHAPSNFGIIPYATAIDATFVRNARQHVGYIYVQNDTLPNPWDSVPGNFGDLLAALE